MSAKAKFGENEKIVAHRIGNFKEKIYLDLADDQWRVIEIDDMDGEFVTTLQSLSLGTVLIRLCIPVKGEHRFALEICQYP